MEKALVYYNSSKYQQCLSELEGLLAYFEKERKLENNDWVLQQVNSFRDTVLQVVANRKQAANALEKQKHWEIVPYFYEGMNLPFYELHEQEMEW